jgi:hypothetical protein
MSELYSQIQKILASEGQSGDFFGGAVALSMHGDTVLVGAKGDNGATGSAYVFTYSDSVWIQRQKLLASDGVSFGIAVALSADGNTVLVGANNAVESQGRAYVFVKSNAGSSWVLQAKLSDSMAVVSNASFGNAVALSADGNVGLIAEFIASRVAFFTRSDATWRQRQSTQVGIFEEGYFGSAVALSYTGSTALIGAEGIGTGGTAYIFMRSDNVWSDYAQFVSNDVVSGDKFGISVALSGDGQTALVGAPQKNGQQGAVYVFAYSDGLWPQQHKFSPSDVVSSDQFGASVALGISADGSTTALIGAPGGNKSYIFTFKENVWSLSQKIMASDSALSSNFGGAVALAGHGLIGLIGASAFSDNQGSAYVFRAPSSVTAAPGTNTTFISFLPDVLIATIVLYMGVAGMFLYNAFEE